MTVNTGAIMLLSHIKDNGKISIRAAMPMPRGHRFLKTESYRLNGKILSVREESG